MRPDTQRVDAMTGLNEKLLIRAGLFREQVPLDLVHERNARRGDISTLHIWPAPGNSEIKVTPRHGATSGLPAILSEPGRELIDSSH